MLKALLEKRAALTLEADELVKLSEAEDRDLTAEEDTRFDAICAELKTLDKRIGRAQEVEGRTAELAKPVTRAQARHIDPGANPAASAGPEPKTLFENDAEFFATIASGRDDQRLARYYADQTMQDGTLGGFMVPKEYSSELQSVAPQGGIFRARSRVIPAGSSPDAAISFPVLNQSTANAAAPANVYAGVAVGWGAEGAAVGATGFKVKEVELKPQECTAYIPVTNKLLRNWSAASGVVSGLLNGARAAEEDLRFALGDGIGKPLGALASGACLSVTRAGAGAVAYSDLVGMIAKVLMRGGTPFWRMSQSVLPELLTMEDTEGHLVWQPNARDGVPPSLLGYPIEWDERAVQLGSAGDISLLNLQYYWIKDGYGPIIASSEHVQFLNNKTVFKMGFSVDGQPWLEEPFTQEGGYQVSPFVKLAA